VVALGEEEALPALELIAPELPHGALLVDTLSTKTRYLPRLRDWAERTGLEAVSINPMFAPSLGFRGRGVAVVDVQSGPRAARFRELLRQQGGRLVELKAEEYDPLMAVLQTATHAALFAFGRALVASGADVGRLLPLASPPHLALLCLLARIVSAKSPHVYWDIQASGNAGFSAREQMRLGLAQLDAQVGEGDAEGFAHMLAELNRAFGGELAPLADACRDLFLQPPFTRS
jgi:prephenate dehydrogenase